MPYKGEQRRVYAKYRESLIPVKTADFTHK